MNNKNPKQIPLIISAIGIVFGDIGTSPLYALKSCLALSNLAVTDYNILGLISVFIWILFMVVTIKYVYFVLNANHQGEGGILILSSLCSKVASKRIKHFAIVLGVIGTALFFGDGVITPAISILSAVEGLQVISPFFSKFVSWIAITLILLLFLVQKRGTGALGILFGPIIIIWFTVIGVLGIASIIETPAILHALNPYYAVHFLYSNGIYGLLALGGTIIILTGCEALYADLGHFGKTPIKLSWNCFVFPALALNYLGQGGLLLRATDAISNPFYLLAPSWGLYPLIILATLSTIIASQAVISGMFSLSWQGIMLNYLPRLRVIHTSYSQIGQVYVPSINYILCVLSIGAVIKFQSSENMASAYGLTVAGIMIITTLMIFLVAYYQWRWKAYKLIGLFSLIFLLDFIFLITNLTKILDGAWYTVLIALIVGYVIKIWIQGNKALNYQKSPLKQSLDQFIQAYEKKYPAKIPGTAIFMGRFSNVVPNSLLIHLHHNKYLHSKIIFVSILTKDSPYVPLSQKYSVREIAPTTYNIIVQYGFKEIADLSRLMNWARDNKIIAKEEDLSFFLSKGVAVASPRSILSGFGESLYIFLSKNSLAAYEFYKIPHDKVIELGVRYKI